MKLSKDFGVRALLALVAAIGYYALLFIVIVRFNLSEETMIGLLGGASSPWLLAMGFYFGSHVASRETPTNVQQPPSTPSKP